MISSHAKLKYVTTIYPIQVTGMVCILLSLSTKNQPSVIL